MVGSASAAVSHVLSTELASDVTSVNLLAVPALFERSRWVESLEAEGTPEALAVLHKLSTLFCLSSCR